MIQISKDAEHTRQVMAYGDLEDITLDLCSLLEAINSNTKLKLAYEMAQEIYDAVENKENTDDKQCNSSWKVN